MTELARARGQWLHAPGGDVVRHLLAVQAQDARMLPFALEARGGAFRDGLLVTWLMRGTLHLVDADDLAWLHPLFASRMGSDRRLAQLGVGDPDRYVAQVAGAVPATRAQLRELTGLEASPLAHVLGRAASRGLIAMTPDRTVVPLSLPPAGDRAQALDELARRYYASHASATRDDLAYWSGLPLRDCRPPPEAAATDEGPVPRRLLPAFDELLLGWRDRTPTVPSKYARRVHPGGGIIRPIVLEDGVATGTWSLRAGEITETPFFSDAG